MSPWLLVLRGFSSQRISQREAGRRKLTRLKPLYLSALKLQYDELLSNVAFKFTLRRYSEVERARMVGWCRLPNHTQVETAWN
jgi:hypothetical protein